MAKYLGLLSTDMRGKIGGLVASRGRSGTTLRAKVTPTAAPSKLQATQRTRMAAALQSWRSLTEFNQLSWGSIAAAQTWTNSLAQTYVPTGLQLYQQAFINAAYFGVVPPATATGSPSTITPINAVQPAFSGVNATATAYDTAGTYAGSWILFMSAPLSPSVNYIKSISMAVMRSYYQTTAGNFYAQYISRYGNAPVVGAAVALRALPVDITNYYSGTPFLVSTLWA
jgi:hypothetical protein